MKRFEAGTRATVVFNLVDDSGEALVFSELKTRVLDETGAILQDWQAIGAPTEPDTEVSVDVIAALNLLTPPATRGAREIQLSITTTSGTFVKSEIILIQAQSPLYVGHNSFMTLAMAAVMRIEDLMTDAGVGYSKEMAENALIDAHAAILNLPIVTPDGAKLKDIEYIDFATIPAKMLTALQKAQVLEAVEIARQDPIERARRKGLVSMTVGESSQFFGTAKLLDQPLLSREATSILAPYFSQRTIRIGRGG